MNEVVNVEGVRGAALDRIERGERNYKLAFYSALAAEALFLGAFLVLADFSDRTHTLLLLATVALYTILALGLLALGAHINRTTLRVLKAVELLAERIAGGAGR